MKISVAQTKPIKGNISANMLQNKQLVQKKAMLHYPGIAKQLSMPVLMSNCVGYCDQFVCVGKSSIWSKYGELVGQLDDKSEGVLTFDTENEAVIRGFL